MTLELNNQYTRSLIEKYYDELEYNQPPQSLGFLFQESNFISKIYYLYEYFAKNNTIKNKRKRLVVVEMFYKLINQRIQDVVAECDGVHEDIVNETIMRIINAPTIIVNFDPTKNLIVQTYREIIKKIKHLSKKVGFNIINRLVVLGQEELLFEFRDQQITQIIKTNFISITKNYKILTYLIRHNERLFEQFIESLEDSNKQQMIQKLIFSQQLRPSSAQLLNKISLHSEETLLTNLISIWCDGGFLNQTPYVQKLTTNLISLKLERMTKDYLSSVMVLINKGITERFQYSKSFQFIRESGLIVWKAYAKGLDLEESIQEQLKELSKIELFQDDKQLQSKETRSILISNQQTIKKVSIPITQPKKIPTSQETEGTQIESEGQSLFKPKNLYDCYLGLTSDSYKRKQICLKAVPIFVRTGEPDLIFNSSKILNILLFLHDETSSISSFSNLRMDAITSLIVYEPVQSVKTMTDRFYNKECCLADKIMILNSMNEAIIQLSNNPEKYKIQIKGNQQEFYFKKVTSKYYKQEEQLKKQKQTERLEKLDNKSRRWGHTKKAHQLLRISESNSTLLPMTNKDLLINDPFINRLYQIVDEIFFTFVYKITSLDHLLNEITFMDCLFGTLNTFLSHIENYHKKYRIIEEVVDILKQIKSKNPQIQKGKLGVVLKMVGIFDKNINYYELLLLNLQEVLQSFYDLQKTSYDPSIKIILEIVEQRLSNLLNAVYAGKKESKVFILAQN